MVLRFAKTCEPCKEVLHDRCWGHLGELMGYEHVPCPCGCRDEFGELTHAALMEMARRQPEALVAIIRFRDAMKRSSMHGHHPFRRG